MIYIAVCDDEEKTLLLLKERLAFILAENKILAEVTGYSQSSLLQYDMEEGKYFDLIISDINMPGIDGLGLAKCVREYLEDALIIFVTSHMEYVLDAFALSVFRYVPKDEMEPRFGPAVMDAVKIIQGRSQRVYDISTQVRAEKIPYKKILYIKREGKYSVISLTDGNAVKIRKSLSTVLKELDSEDFVFVDRGNIVNLPYIIKIKDGCVELENGIRLCMSRAKAELVKKKISKYWGKRI